MEKSSLQVSDDQAAAVAKTENRVTLESVQAKIEQVEYVNPVFAPQMTVAIVKCRNGFVVIGESASADPKNFNAELGRKFALENATRKIWQMEGYLLCEKLAA